MNKKYLTQCVSLVAILVLSPIALHAATTTETLDVKIELTHLFLWSDDPSAVTFDGIDLSKPELTGWTVANLGDSLVTEGPELKKGDAKFDIDFNYSVAPFTFQYAAVLFDTVSSTYTIQDTGNVTYNGKKLDKPVGNPLTAAQSADVSAHFGPAPAVVPIPNSMLLMISAIGFVGFKSRTNARTVAQG